MSLSSSIQATEKSLGFFIKMSLYHFPFYDVYCVCFAAFKLVIVLAWFLLRQPDVINVDPQFIVVVVVALRTMSTAMVIAGRSVH